MRSFIFSMPLPVSEYRNGRREYVNKGNLTISGTYIKDEEGITPEITEVKFCGVNILPVIEYSQGLKGNTLMDHITDAVSDHLSETTA